MPLKFKMALLKSFAVMRFPHLSKYECRFIKTGVTFE